MFLPPPEGGEGGKAYLGRVVTNCGLTRPSQPSSPPPSTKPFQLSTDKTNQLRSPPPLQKTKNPTIKAGPERVKIRKGNFQFSS